MFFSPLIRTAMTVVTGIGLVACQSNGPTGNSPNTDDHATFASTDHDVEVHYATALKSADDPVPGYFDNGGWKTDANAPGQRLLVLALPDSDEIATGLWRLGASRDATAVNECLMPPDNARSIPGETSIGGHAFVGFTLGDAGMSHFQRVEGYRAVVGGTCYAIDLIVQGTNGAVYDPPKKAPFSQDDAMKRLRAINDGVTFPARS